VEAGCGLIFTNVTTGYFRFEALAVTAFL